jgi:hypothetical protein
MMEADRIAETAAMLERAVRDAGHLLTGDGRVSESVAAQLIGISTGHLRRLRRHSELPGHRLGLNGARISYRLVELARFIEACSTDADDAE